MQGFTFLHPWFFLLLIPLLVLVWFVYVKNSHVQPFSGFSDLIKVYQSNSVYIKLYYILIFCILFFFVAIFSNFVSQVEKEKETKEGVDINIVLDVSYSMLAEDMKPSRLEVSKKIIGEFVGGLKNDRVGVTIFAGKPFVSLPLNFDYNVTRKIIGDISVDTIDQRTFRMQGTAIGDALVLAGESFDIDDNREKIIILLTDGEANKGLQPMAAVQYLKGKLGDRVKLYTIGIGGGEKTFVVLDDGFGGKNKIEVAGVDEKKLQDIAGVTGGKYFRASDEKSMESIFETIGKLEKHELETEYFTVSKPKNSIFVFLLVCFFFGFISLIIRKKI